jgi:uncharacterized protein involved in exopolysaccharide biosynthesis
VQTVLLAQRSQMSTLPNPGMSREWDVPTRAAREVVVQRQNLVALAKQVNLAERYLQTRAPIVRAKDWLTRLVTGTEPNPADLFEGLVDTLQSRLLLYPGPEGTITISLDWSNREVALHVVQAALQTFLEERRVAEIQAVGEAIAIFQSHDARVQEMIEATVEKVEKKSRALRLGVTPRRSLPAHPRPTEDRELARLETTLATRNRALGELETLRQQRLAEMQALLLQQQTVYAPRHPILEGTREAIATLSRPSPQILALQAEVRELEGEITRRGGRPGDAASVPTSVDADISEASLRILQMDDPRLEAERRELEDLLRQHTSLLQRIDSARLEMDTAQAAFKYRYAVITPPQLPKSPLKPYGLLYLIGGFLGGTAMAFFASAAADVWGGKVVERWQVEKGLKLPVLADIGR